MEFSGQAWSPVLLSAAPSAVVCARARGGVGCGGAWPVERGRRAVCCDVVDAAESCGAAVVAVPVVSMTKTPLPWSVLSGADVA